MLLILVVNNVTYSVEQDYGFKRWVNKCSDIYPAAKIKFIPTGNCYDR